MFVRGPLETPDCVPHAEGGYSDFHLPDGKKAQSTINIKKTQITINIIPVAQTVEHDASNAKVMGSTPRECMN